MSALVLKMLERAAEQGAPCPSNTEITEVIGGSKSAPVKALARLEKQGSIQVWRGNHSRVVTIVATGKRTAGEIGEVHWRLRDPVKAAEANAKTRLQKHTPTLAPVPVLPRVCRDACFRCGVRADIGCAHQRPRSPP